MADPQHQAARRRLRGRNIAVLLALAGFVTLIYLVTVARLQTGLEATMEAERLEAEAAAQEAAPDDAADIETRDGAAAATDPAEAGPTATEGGTP